MSQGLPYQAGLAFLADDATPETVRWRERFFHHNGSCYCRITDEALEGALTRWLARTPSARTEGGKLIDITHALVKNAMLAVRSECMRDDVVEIGSWFTAPPADAVGPYLATVGAILDLGRIDANGAAFIPNSANFFSLASLPVTPDPLAKCPMWLHFLEETFPGSPEAVCLLQEIFGYSLWPKCNFEKFFIFFGPGETGKSTAAETLQAILGDANVGALPLERFHERFALASLIGKLANIVFDTAEVDKVAEGNLKAMVSGELVTIEEKNLPVYSTRLTAKHIILANVLPRFHDTTTGLWRRLIVLPFDRVCPPEQRDPNLKARLRTELAGIASWAIEGLARLIKQGDFTIYERGRKLAADYRQDSNPVTLFLNAECMQDPNGRVGRQALYARYKAWAADNGHAIMSSQRLYRAVESIHPQSDVAVRDGRGGDRMFVGIALRERADVAQRFRELTFVNGKPR